jgi:GNAT superfamily N-acetyltransferase
MEYRQEFLSSVVEDIQPLLQSDWDEIEHQKDRRPLDPDWDAYADFESQGLFKIFTARHEGALVGYVSCFLHPDLHSKGLTSASFEILFVDKAHRNGVVGPKLIKFAENCVKQDGADFCFISTTGRNSATKLMQRLGYSVIETKLEKALN